MKKLTALISILITAFFISTSFVAQGSDLLGSSKAGRLYFDDDYIVGDLDEGGQPTVEVCYFEGETQVLIVKYPGGSHSEVIVDPKSISYLDFDIDGKLFSSLNYRIDKKGEFVLEGGSCIPEFMDLYGISMPNEDGPYDPVWLEVSSVKKGAFKNSKTLKSLSIGSTITTIGADAFNGCKNLESIVIWDTHNLKKIGKNAFKGINKNATLTISATKKEFKRIKKLFRKAGFPKTAKIVRFN